MRLKLCAFVSGILLFVNLPAAHGQIYRVSLLGESEIPPVSTPAFGRGIITLNRNTHEMRVSANFTGLRGTTTASHIHCCTVQPANAGVATTTPTFLGFPLGVTSGSWDRIYDMTQASTWNAVFVTNNGGTIAGAESALFTGVELGQSYLNIHTSMFAGGEIRGTLELFRFTENDFLARNSRGVAGALDSLGAGTGALNNTLVSMAFLTPAERATALAQLTPSTSRGRLTVTAGNFDTNFDLVGSRLDGVRWSDRSQRLSDSGIGIWVAGHGLLNGRQYQVDGFSGFDGDGWGLAGGVDHRLESGTVIGAAVGYSDSELEYLNQDAGDLDDISSTQLSVYLGQDIGRFFLQGTAGYAWQRYDSTRDTGATGLATASFNGRQWGGRLALGVPLSVSSTISFTPQVRLTWARDRQNAYDETGGGPMGLAVAEKSVDRFRGSLGGQFDFGTTEMSGFKTRPFLRGFWSHQLDDKGRDTTATFLAGGGSFITPGQKLDRDPITLGAGANFFSDGPFSAGVTYDLTLGDASQSSVLQGSVNWSF
jgi:outer membrane autotransporter protein